MTKQKLIGILLLFISSIAFSSCKEKFECNANNNVPIPQIMKDYFHYKEGTWWVYKNVKNNTYDSMWVFQSSSNYYQGDGKEGFGSTDKCYEHAVIGINNKKTKDFMRWDLANISTDEKSRFIFSISWRDTSTTANKGIDLRFTNGILENEPLHPVKYNLLDSVVIQNIKYKELMERNSYNYFYDNIKYRLFAKNIGLVKYVDRDSNQWELLKYNINQ